MISALVPLVLGLDIKDHLALKGGDLIKWWSLTYSVQIQIQIQIHTGCHV